MLHSADRAPSFMATATKALVLARDLTDTAARLRAAAAELLEAAASIDAGRASSLPPPPAQDAAVARGGAGFGQHNTRPALVVGSVVNAPTAVHRHSVISDTLDDANLELAAAARYGSWKPKVRATRQRRALQR